MSAAYRQLTRLAITAANRFTIRTLSTYKTQPRRPYRRGCQRTRRRDRLPPGPRCENRLPPAAGGPIYRAEPSPTLPLPGREARPNAQPGAGAEIDGSTGRDGEGRTQRAGGRRRQESWRWRPGRAPPAVLRHRHGAMYCTSQQQQQGVVNATTAVQQLYRSSPQSSIHASMQHLLTVQAGKNYDRTKAARTTTTQLQYNSNNKQTYCCIADAS